MVDDIENGLLDERAGQLQGEVIIEIDRLAEAQCIQFFRAHRMAGSAQATSSTIFVKVSAMQPTSTGPVDHG